MDIGFCKLHHELGRSIIVHEAIHLHIAVEMKVLTSSAPCYHMRKAGPCRSQSVVISSSTPACSSGFSVDVVPPSVFIPAPRHMEVRQCPREQHEGIYQSSVISSGCLSAPGAVTNLVRNVLHFLRNKYQTRLTPTGVWMKNSRETQNPDF